jgi:hypothetical protein
MYNWLRYTCGGGAEGLEQSAAPLRAGGRQQEYLISLHCHWQCSSVHSHSSWAALIIRLAAIAIRDQECLTFLSPTWWPILGRVQQTFFRHTQNEMI